MYDIMKQTETMSQILPQTVNRMLALNTIHQQGMYLNIFMRKTLHIFFVLKIYIIFSIYFFLAATFNKSLMRLEELQSQITSDLESNKSLLKGVQESFASNLEIIKNNIESLDERIKKLNK